MHYKPRAVIFSSIFYPITCLSIGITLLVTPVRSQDASPSPSPTVEVTQTSASAKPEVAMTTKDPTIPVEELILLIKPLTLAELENEAAAWSILLKNKVQAISDAEIAIKRLNQSINKQKEAADAANQSNEALKSSQAVLARAVPNSPEYVEARKKEAEIEINLEKAQKAVEEAKTAKLELEKYPALVEAVEQARKSEELVKSQTAFDKAKEIESKMLEKFPWYKNEEATQKRDNLKKAIENFEKAQAELNKFSKDSPEFAQLTQKIIDLEKSLKTAREAIEGTSKSSVDPTEKSATELNKAENTLKDSQLEPDKNSRDTTFKEIQTIQEKSQQLEIATEQLNLNAEFESKLKNQLVANVTQLQLERTAIVDRFNAILEELKRKGGDPKSYQQYIEAVSVVLIDVKDSEGLGVRLVKWLQSDQGGMRWSLNISKFIGIVIASVIISQIVGIIIDGILKILSRKTSVTMRQFVVMLIKRGGVVVGMLLALTALEISLGPILALAGGISFILAFALQSNLGNFASGLTMMLYKPFDIGDEVKVNGIAGYVDAITLPSTIIRGFGGQIFTIPNGAVWSNPIENFTHSDKRKIAIWLRIALHEDLQKVEQLMLETIKSHPKILTEPQPSIIVGSVEEYYIKLGVSGWSAKGDFWGTYADIIRLLHKEFTKAGIRIAAIPEHIITASPASQDYVKSISHLSEASLAIEQTSLPEASSLAVEKTSRQTA